MCSFHTFALPRLIFIGPPLVSSDDLTCLCHTPNKRCVITSSVAGLWAARRRSASTTACIAGRIVSFGPQRGEGWWGRWSSLYFKGGVSHPISRVLFGNFKREEGGEATERWFVAVTTFGQRMRSHSELWSQSFVFLYD